MGNINQPISRYLFNEVLNKDWGLFLDENSVKNLFLKKYGRTIPKTGTTLTVSDYDPGKYHAHFLEMVKRPVVAGEPVEFGYSFVKKMRKPGVHNNEYFTHQQYYGGKLLGAMEPTDFVIEDDDVLNLEDQIIASAKLHYLDTSCIDKCFVNLRRAYVVNDSDNTDASGFTVTLEDGSTVVFATGTTFAAGQLAAQFNALSTVNTKLMAIRMAADKYLITSIDPFYKFTIGTLVDTTISNRYIYAENLELGYDVEVRYEQGQANKMSAYITSVNGATATTPGMDIYVDGTKYTPTTSSTFATFLANINTAVNGVGVYATKQSTANIFIYAPATVNVFNVTLSDSSTYTLVKEVTPKGGFSALTSDDVFRLFMNKGNHGALATQQYVTQPINGGIYRKYRLATSFIQDAVGGAAGGKESVEHIVEIYVLKSAALVNKFKDGGSTRYMDETLPGSADTTLDALIKLTVS